MEMNSYFGEGTGRSGLVGSGSRDSLLSMTGAFWLAGWLAGFNQMQIAAALPATNTYRAQLFFFVSLLPPQFPR